MKKEELIEQIIKKLEKIDDENRLIQARDIINLLYNQYIIHQEGRN